MNPQISIIMPIFNQARFVLESIQLIYKTIHKTSWELLLCNDGSTDNTHDVLLGRIFDKRVRLVYSSIKNEGAAIARNKLIEKAESDTIMILDGDNILCDGVVDRMYEDLNSHRKSLNCHVVSPEKLQFFTDRSNIDPKDCWDFGYLKKEGDMYTVCDLQDMLVGFKVPPCSGNYMYHKKVWEAVGGYRKEDIQETHGFGFRHIAAGYPVFILPDSQYLHRFVRDGYYGRLSKNEMDHACRSLLEGIKDRLTKESQEYLSNTMSGKEAISSGRLRLE
jgi:glycosyltransferase involved in cell wall biosynthesis